MSRLTWLAQDTLKKTNSKKEKKAAMEMEDIVATEKEDTGNDSDVRN